MIPQGDRGFSILLGPENPIKKLIWLIFPCPVGYFWCTIRVFFTLLKSCSKGHDRKVTPFLLLLRWTLPMYLEQVRPL